MSNAWKRLHLVREYVVNVLEDWGTGTSAGYDVDDIVAEILKTDDPDYRDMGYQDFMELAARHEKALGPMDGRRVRVQRLFGDVVNGRIIGGYITEESVYIRPDNWPAA